MPTPSLTVANFALVALGEPTAARDALGASSGPDLTRYALVCVGLLALIALGAYLFRRFLGAALQRRAAARSLQIMDVLPLGGKQRLAVVRCYDRTFLLGLGEKEVASITELDAVIAPAREPSPSRADLQSFSGVLERVAKVVKPSPAATAEKLRKEGVLG